MRGLTRLGCAWAMALVVTLGVAAAAPAAKKRHHKRGAAAAWAHEHGLKGAWRTRDRDRDGLTNLAEFRLRTDPRRKDTDRDRLRDGAEVDLGLDPRAGDSDGDGVRDGDEHAGTVGIFESGVLTIRLARGGRLSAPVDPDVALECASDDEPVDDGPVDDSADVTFVEDYEDVLAAGDGAPLDDDAGEPPLCEELLLTPGSRISEAELATVDGELRFVAIAFAD